MDYDSQPSCAALTERSTNSVSEHSEGGVRPIRAANKNSRVYQFHPSGAGDVLGGSAGVKFPGVIPSAYCVRWTGGRRSRKSCTGGVVATVGRSRGLPLGRGSNRTL